MADLLDKMRARRTVLIRTTKRPDLPESALYLEWLGGQASRKVLGADHKEHILTDAIVRSNFKLASGPEAEVLVTQHWGNDVAEPQQPIRKSEQDAPPAPKKAKEKTTQARPSVKAKNAAKGKPARSRA